MITAVNSVLLLFVLNSLHLNMAVRFNENKQVDRLLSLLSEQDVEKVLRSELSKDDKAVLEEFDKLKSLIHKAKVAGKSHGSKLMPKVERKLKADGPLSELDVYSNDQENKVIDYNIDDGKGSKLDADKNLSLLENIYKALTVLRSLNRLKSTDSTEDLSSRSDYTYEITKKSEVEDPLQEKQSSNTFPLTQFNEKINKCIENLQDIHQQFYTNQSPETESLAKTKKCLGGAGGPALCNAG